MYELLTLEIYLDILFVLNFIMDYFIFWMVSKITYKKITNKRLFLGSLVAAMLYCLAVIVPFFRSINMVIYLIALPIIPIIIIFEPSNLKEFVQIFVISNIVALIIGGMSYGLIYWSKGYNLTTNIYSRSYNNFSLYLLFISIVASYIIIQSFRYYIQRRNTSIEKLYPLKILHNDQVIEVNALLDTGNKVYDPITKYPVIIIEYAEIEKLLPEGIQKLYLKGEEDITCFVEEASKSEFGRRIRIIPYQSLGNPNGMLLGFKADKIYVGGRDNKEEYIEQVILAIYIHTLSKEGKYTALLHADLIS
ncbi:MAG: sigma-E processing peptidase SpoIIGA [Epulopiscium sp.]|nr:sigma-E processing peptidase SpoIIGA [Candidatus Epulonipiscium sp.]